MIIIITEVDEIRLEAWSKLLGSKYNIAGLSLLVYAWKTEGYGFVEFEV